MDTQKQIHLNALQLDVSLNWNEFFYDEGFVDIPRSHLKKQHGIDHDGDPDGFCHHPTIGGFKFVYIFYKKFPEEELNVYIRGHEETHALIRLGKLKFLLLDMVKHKNLSHFLECSVGSYEEMAIVGGIYALKRRDMSTEPLKRYARD